MGGERFTDGQLGAPSAPGERRMRGMRDTGREGWGGVGWG